MKLIVRKKGGIPVPEKKRFGMTGKKCLILVVGILLLVWSLLPVVADGMFGVGAAVPCGVALGLLWYGLRRREKKEPRKGWKRIVWIVGIVLACLLTLLGGIMTGLMVRSATKTPAENATVVVLGSKIHGDQPSRMLRDRLQVAAEYLRANPEAKCVVTGGLGPGETYTEAYVMEKYLVEQEGIAPERIARDDASTDTRENLAFALDIIRQRGWNTHVVTATQVFHQYRAGQMALDAGADSVGGAACLTPWHLMLNYWVRECAAICRLWIVGY